MSVIDSSFESEADSSDILVSFEMGTECFLSDDSRTKTNKEADVDDRANRKISVRFSIKRGVLKMPYSVNCQCGDT